MSDKKKILVTGAGGFIGGRIVEVLHALGTGEVRAGLRRWSSGARIGRFPMEMVKCDVRNAEEVENALRDITHVVHCAVGEQSTTVEGTRVLMEAALKAGVKRVVHISTVDVYGTPEGTVDETHPLTVTGRPYGDSKIAAEAVCQELAARGLPVTILRPSLVHGPFSATWTIAYAQRLQSRPWLVAEEDARGTCNLVYVDDLVGAVIAALDANTPSGEAFNINGPERPSWGEYFHALNDAMGLPQLESERQSRARLSALAVQPVRKSAKLVLKRFQNQVTFVYQRSELARTIMKRAEHLIRTTPAPAEFTVYSRRTSFSTEKAERMLGYKPRFPLARALPLTAAWLKHNGFVTAAPATNGNHH
ncbi:MAG TPA: NAD-dependent epimerase/dehydratase family protein [Longimicrobiales bacterium]